MADFNERCRWSFALGVCNLVHDFNFHILSERDGLLPRYRVWILDVMKIEDKYDVFPLEYVLIAFDSEEIIVLRCVGGSYGLCRFLKVVGFLNQHLVEGVRICEEQSILAESVNC